MVIGFLSYVGWQAYVYLMDKQQVRVPVTISRGTFQARVADTEALREQGLSGTKVLQPTDAMLFVFDENDKHGIWMKDMNFPIDIVWLDEKKKVIFMVKHAEPSSYPFTTFKPTKPARYVIELPADTIERKDIIIGDKAVFDLSSIQKEGGE
jgi:uncharacterized membrane protein (UPF0127 family)